MRTLVRRSRRCRLASSLVGAHHGDAREAFFQQGRNKFRPHRVDRLRRDDSIAAAIAGLTYVRWRIEEQRFQIAAERAGDFHVWRPVGHGQVCSVNIRDGSTERKPPPYQVTNCGEHLRMNRLNGGVIGQHQAYRIGGDRVHAELLKIRGFA